MSKSIKFFVFGGLVLIAILGMLFGIAAAKSSKITTFEECEKAGWLLRSIRIYDGVGSIEKECFLWTGKSFAKERDNRVRATESLKFVADTANELSGIKSGAVFNFEIIDLDGTAANFGIVQYVSEVKGEQIVEEHIVKFKNQNYISEVNRDTSAVVSMHQPVPEFALGQGRALPANELEARARKFVERVYPEFKQIESTLEFDPGEKNAPGVATNHFYRWNDKQYAVPNGAEMDLPPFIQVGINANGFIFSYDNTIQLYYNLPREALRNLCGLVDMPKTDDSLLDRERGIVKAWFTEYEPFQNRYFILPYEPETDFAGCSEPVKEFLRRLPNEPK